MHEFALTQNLLDRALKYAQSKHILRVNLLIGSFSDEREDSIRFYWKDLAKGSAVEGTEIHFDHVETEMKCLDCSGMFYLDEDEDCTCKYCYGDHLHLLIGDDVELEGIELE